MTDRLLQSTWSAIERSGDRFSIRATVSAIESAYSDGESGLVVGHCKEIVEGICKSILDENSISYAVDSKVGWLAKNAIQALDVAKGVENEKKAREAFKKLITGFANNFEIAAQAIGELRNDFCPLAHGKSSTHIPLDLSYAEFVAKQADAIIGFIYELYINHKILKPDIAYQDNEDFNEYLNDEYGKLEIYGDDYWCAEILYQVNKEKYEIALNEYKEQKEEGAA